MDKLAVEQAKAKLRKAEKSLEELKNATSYDASETAWSDFLIATSTIYSKLEQGSKGNGKSQGWFGRKKKIRRDDPLLRYLHYARNSDEHGIEYVVARGGNTHGFGGKKLKFNEREAVTIQLFDKDKKIIPGSDSPAMLYGPSIQLARVHDHRFSDYCDPPVQHMGAIIEIGDLYVYGVGRLGLNYLAALVAEAETLVSDSKNIAK